MNHNTSDQEEGTWGGGGRQKETSRGEWEPHGLLGHMTPAQTGRGICLITIDSSPSPSTTRLYLKHEIEKTELRQSSTRWFDYEGRGRRHKENICLQIEFLCLLRRPPRKLGGGFA